MVKIRYPDSPEERDRLRDAMRRRGQGGIDEIAAAFRERWAYGHLRSYRMVLELSQEKACAEVNKLLGVHAGDDGYFDHSALSRIERWPYSGRRPTISQLVALATVYGTTPRNLIAPSDLDRYPPADQLTLTNLDHMAPTGPTANATTAGMMDQAGPQAQAIVHTPHTPWARPDAIQSGTPVERLVTMTGDETVQYGDRSSNIGEITIERLHADVGDLARRWGTASSLDLFGGIRLLRDRLFAYLDAPGRTSTTPNRELHFLAAAACGMLGDVSNDLGYPTAAMSHFRVALMFAKEAGSNTLAAWVRGEQAVISYWNGQYTRARDYALAGQELRPVGTVAVFLPAIEARASGELSEHDASRGAIHRATDTRATVQPGDLDQYGGLMAFNQAKQHFYAAGAYLGVGDNPNVITEATAALDAYGNGPTNERNFKNEALSQLQAATAHVLNTDLDAAEAHTRAALGTAPEHHTSVTDTAARRLHRHLCTANFRGSQLAIDTREQIEDFLTLTSARPLLP